MIFPSPKLARRAPKQRKPIARTALLKKSQPAKKSAAKKSPSRRPIPRNRKRSAAAFARAYGSKRAWIVSRSCAVCQYPAPSEPAHTKGDGGMGRKASSKYLLPLCGPRINRVPGACSSSEGCHAETHRVGVKTFEKDHGVSLEALAAQYDAEYRGLVGGSAEGGAE